MANSLQARLNYLTDAAHILSAACPETSAYFMSARHALTSRNDIPITDVEKQHVCTTCGNILIPGCSSILKLESDRALRQKRQQRLGRARSKPQDKSAPPRETTPKGTAKIERQGATKAISCNRCERVTKVRLPPPPPPRRPKEVVTLHQVAAVRNDSETKKPSSNAVSKKRAKNRKAGLQALLAESKGSSSKSSSGLSLASFMKK